MRGKRSFTETIILFLLVAIVLQTFAKFSSAEVGTAAFYRGPYVPTACYGSSELQIPADNLFAAASDRVWENGAACGREYTVRCLSGTDLPNPCLPERIVKVRIVDHAPPVSTPSSSGTTLVLTVDAFNTIVDPNSTASQINVEFIQV